MLVNYTFNQTYLELLKKLGLHGVKSTNRKGQEITELFDQAFRLTTPMFCLADCRGYSKKYLLDELAFYVSGSNSVEDAAKLSKFWLKCTDNGRTINSNYGKLIFHDRNSKGFTQYEHALNCLKNNSQSKKAVMTLYNNENAYISNDNPCTMFLRARIGGSGRLHLSTYMRSSDIYFGLPYDVPFFVFVQYCLCRDLGVPIGHYTHHTCSLHKYASKYDALYCIQRQLNPPTPPFDLIPIFEGLRLALKTNRFMSEAWSISKHAVCLKKHVGACLTNIDENGEEYIVALDYGGTNSEACKHCKRDDVNDRYYGDECPAIHAEMKLILGALKSGPYDFSKATIYVTHGPCDACLKLCDAVGVKKVVYDKPYKTNYAHWPNVEVVNINETKC